MSNYRWQIYLSVCTSTSKTILQTNPLIDVQNLTMAVWTSHRSFSPTEPAQRAFYVWLLRSAIVRQIPLISFMGGYSCNAVSNVKTKYICSRPWIKKQQLTSKHAPDVALNNRTIATRWDCGQIQDTSTSRIGLSETSAWLSSSAPKTISHSDWYREILFKDYTTRTSLILRL